MNASKPRVFHNLTFIRTCFGLFVIFYVHILYFPNQIIHLSFLFISLLEPRIAVVRNNND